MVTIMHKPNTQYIRGQGCIFTRKHPSLNYGQTGTYWTDASSLRGYAWFAMSFDSGVEKPAPAVLVKVEDIFTKDDSYINGTEAP
jgi:hypothetical protein